MNEPRLRELAALLDRVATENPNDVAANLTLTGLTGNPDREIHPPTDFDLSQWFAPDTGCGSTACAVGFAMCHPPFVEQGLGMYAYPGPLGTVVPAFIDDDIQLLEFSAVEAFFEIDHWDAKALFLNTRYPEADVTAADVAARVRELLETGDLSNHLERDDPDDDEPDDDEPYDSDDDDDADADDADDEQEADIS